MVFAGVAAGLLSSIILLISLAFELVALCGSSPLSLLSSSSAGSVIAHGFSCSSECLGIPPSGDTFLFVNVPKPATGLTEDADCGALTPRLLLVVSNSCLRSSEERRPSLGLRDRT